MPPWGVGRGHRLFTQRGKINRCVCGVSSTAFKAHRRPKTHSSPGVPRNRGSWHNALALFPRTKAAVPKGPAAFCSFNYCGHGAVLRWADIKI